MRSPKKNNGGNGGSSSESDTRSSKRSAGGDGRRHRSGRDGQPRSLIGKAWRMIVQLFFLIVHIYKSLTAFWSQMNVCMLPALGELDHQEEQEQQELAAAAAAAQATPGSPGQRKRAAKVH